MYLATMKSFTFLKELNKNVLASEGKPHRPETMKTTLPQKISMLAMTSQF